MKFVLTSYLPFQLFNLEVDECSSHPPTHLSLLSFFLVFHIKTKLHSPFLISFWEGHLFLFYSYFISNFISFFIFLFGFITLQRFFQDYFLICFYYQDFFFFLKLEQKIKEECIFIFGFQFYFWSYLYNPINIVWDRV